VDDSPPVVDLCGDAAAPFDRAGGGTLPSLGAQSCKVVGEPTGAGHATLTFGPDGWVHAVRVERPFAGTQEGQCVAEHARRFHACPFQGEPIVVGKSFTIN
jgi:hypothetical protein